VNVRRPQWIERVAPTRLKEQLRYRAELAAKSADQRRAWSAELNERTTGSSTSAEPHEPVSSNWRFDSSNRDQADGFAQSAFISHLAEEALRAKLAQPARKYRRWVLPRVVPGAVVTVTYDDSPPGFTETLIVDTASFDPEIDVCSPSSPLGAALLGLKVNHAAQFRTPAGHRMVTVLRIVA
jgi:transcription elongation GreA/GreB family factor